MKSAQEPKSIRTSNSSRSKSDRDSAKTPPNLGGVFFFKNSSGFPIGLFEARFRPEKTTGNKMNHKLTQNRSATTKKSSSFVKPAVKRGLSILGTSGLVLGLGVAGGSSASASSAPFECTPENTAVPGLTPTTSRQALEVMFDDQVTQICLDGNFIFDGEPVLTFDYDVEIYGVGNSSIDGNGMPVLVSFYDYEEGYIYDITIDNLLIKNSGGDGAAVQARNVTVRDSEFVGNADSAVYANDSATSLDSVFTNNTSNFAGGAIVAEGDLEINGSTFSGNSADTGGAVYGYIAYISNSTFVENEAAAGGAVSAYGAVVYNSTFVENRAVGEGAEGGAVYARGGELTFNTFLDNVAPDPVDGEDKPGNAIYKENEGPLLNMSILGNIFAGSSQNPQVTYGAAISQIQDDGANVFSTSSLVETDLIYYDSDLADWVSNHPTSVFGASLSSIFGTSSPVLANYEPNSSGTQTIPLAAGSPAIDIVTADLWAGELWGGIEFDQRGAPRAFPADAGAFEGIAPAPATPPAPLAKTGSENSFWSVLTSGGLMTLGAVVIAWAARLRRRSL